MRTDTPKTIYLKDYEPYPFELLSLDLDFDIQDGQTTVTATSKFRKKDKSAKQLFLNGEHLELLSITIDGEETSKHSYGREGPDPPCPSIKKNLLWKSKH